VRRHLSDPSETLSLAFLVLLEQLSPVERAVFLLHDVFGYEYPEIAETAGKREDNYRQLASRARRHIDAEKPRFEATLQESSARGRRRHIGRLRSSPETDGTPFGSRRGWRSPPARFCSRPAPSTVGCRSTTCPTTRG
jgi:Sigma-70, region 4